MQCDKQNARGTGPVSAVTAVRGMPDADRAAAGPPAAARRYAKGRSTALSTPASIDDTGI